MRKSKIPSKLKLPAPLTDPITGRKHYPGSIADMSGAELSDKQRQKMLIEMSKGPVFASKLSEVVQISAFNPHAQQALSLHLANLLKSGLAEFDGKKGFSLTDKGLERIKSKKETDDEEGD